MDHEWDDRKAASNLRKHGVDFADAALALEDDQAVTLRDVASVGEERFVTVARDPDGRILVVVYTARGERIRVISARKATPLEQRAYFEGRR